MEKETSTTKIYNKYREIFDKDNIMPEYIDIFIEKDFKTNYNCVGQTFTDDPRNIYVKIDSSAKRHDRALWSTLFHEFTHVYDFVYFSKEYSPDEIKVIMSSYSEYHAQKITTRTYLFLDNPNSKQKYKLYDFIKIGNKKGILLGLLKSQNQKYVKDLSEYNMQTFRNSMYLCGEIDAYKEIFLENVNNIINTNIIPSEIRDAIIVLCDTFKNYGVPKQVFDKISELYNNINDIICRKIQISLATKFLGGKDVLNNIIEEHKNKNFNQQPPINQYPKD